MGRNTNSCFAGVRLAIASRRDTYINLASEKYINICFAVGPLACAALPHFDMPDTILYQQWSCHCRISSCSVISLYKCIPSMSALLSFVCTCQVKSCYRVMPLQARHRLPQRCIGPSQRLRSRYQISTCSTPRNKLQTGT